jgi:NADPH2:quinone reductase
LEAGRLHFQGGPEVLIFEDIATPALSANDVLVKIQAGGVNFIDTYQRSGLYKIPLPSTLGLEGSGIVGSVGEEVTGFKKGDRVAYTNIPSSFAEFAAVPENKLLALPETVSFNEGAAILLQGCTSHSLCHFAYSVKIDDVCLVHAAAGGVGLLLTQTIKMLGGTDIATVSAPAKEALAKAAGADHTILYTETDFEEEVNALTDGKGVNVAFDSVGKTTFERSINCLKPLGSMVLYGNANGPVTQFNPSNLAPKGSLFLTRPTIFDYLSNRETLEWRSGDLFRWIAQGKLKLRLEHCYPLSAASSAHTALEGRATTGKIILNP